MLIDSTAGPIAAVAPRDAYQDAVLGFEIFGQGADGSRTANTNWPRMLSFPTFCLNTLEYLAGGTEESQLASTQARPAGGIADGGQCTGAYGGRSCEKGIRCAANGSGRVSISEHEPGSESTT